MQLFGSKKHLTDWLDDARSGSTRAQKAIYDELSPKMYAVCLRYMGDREAAQDILQDAFVTLFSKLDTYSGEGSFEGWARKIFVNTALMSLRKHDNLRDAEDVSEAFSISSGEPDAVQKIGYKELIRLIGELPPGFRTVFNLYVLEGYSHKDIADALGISEVTSRSQLQRARVMLQGKIKNL
ncbi:MAG: sigma-70 family RNA polymerase sigma factor [Bacteroidales bacterium]|nr:sigma-70 family RNA polymerase sigma factor [Candidatus Cryptobacteroides aphodequi]